MMQIFKEYKQLKDAENSLADLLRQRAKGGLELKTFYATKKELESIIDNYKNVNKPSLQTHYEYTLGFLLQYTFDELEIADLADASINDLRIFTQQTLPKLTVDTIVILDGYDDEDDEGYTQYVKDNQLVLAYNGELFVDVVSSYKQYRKDFNASLLLKALEYYCEYDTFYQFN